MRRIPHGAGPRIYSSSDIIAQTPVEVQYFLTDIQIETACKHCIRVLEADVQRAFAMV
jgi:hypothetical protein